MVVPWRSSAKIPIQQYYCQRLAKITAIEIVSTTDKLSDVIMLLAAGPTGFASPRLSMPTVVIHIGTSPIVVLMSEPAEAQWQ